MPKEPISVVDDSYNGYYFTNDILENEPINIEITEVYDFNKEQRDDD